MRIGGGRENLEVELWQITGIRSIFLFTVITSTQRRVRAKSGSPTLQRRQKTLVWGRSGWSEASDVGTVGVSGHTGISCWLLQIETTMLLDGNCIPRVQWCCGNATSMRVISTFNQRHIFH